MDKFPDISMAEEDESLEIKDLADDLAVINSDLPPAKEDLKQDPFIRKKAAPLKPEAPIENEIIEKKPAKKEKPKRPLSEKQKAHMANMRRLAREKREAKKKEAKIEEKKEKIMETIPEESKAPEAKVEKNEDDQFGNWLKNMDRYASMQLAYQKEERRKQELAAKKEKALEAKYFAKFQAQQKQQQQAKQAKTRAPTPAPLGNQTDFGPFSKYF